MDAFPRTEEGGKRLGVLKTRDELLKLSSSLAVDSRDARALASESLDKIITLKCPLPREFFLLKSQFEMGVDITNKALHVVDLFSFILTVSFRFMKQPRLTPIPTAAEVRVYAYGNGSEVIQMIVVEFKEGTATQKILIENFQNQGYKLGISIFDNEGKRMLKRDYVV
jgi:hypothetical protein